MANAWDKRIQTAFNKMTSRLGYTISIYPKSSATTRQGYESSTSTFGTVVSETAFLQELDSQHVMVLSGQLNVGDVSIVFQSSTVIKEEDKITVNSKDYKIIKISKFMGMNSNVVTDVRGYGKLLPKR